MTAIRGYVAPTAKDGALGVHSLDHFTLTVPDLKAAQRFYSDFGLDVQDDGNALALKTFGNDQRWGSIVEGKRKKLHHVTFGCFTDDLAALRQRAADNGVEIHDAPQGFESNGFWLRDPSGTLIEVKVAPKVTPDKKTPGLWQSAPEGAAGATIRAKVPLVRPRRLSHLLAFSKNINNAIEFYERNLGLRLSDRTNGVAFMHGIHGSDHHLLAFAQSEAPGMHHCSWDVARIDDIGLGAMHMADKGFAKGWGLGRHVLGSNYFHYVQDPWGSFSEYSCDIDYIPKTQDWQAGHHDDENSFYQWGPLPPDDFVINYEAQN
jgi:catechol 2,3-dioxygenase